MLTRDYYHARRVEIDADLAASRTNQRPTPGRDADRRALAGYIYWLATKEAKAEPTTMGQKHT